MRAALRSGFGRPSSELHVAPSQAFRKAGGQLVRKTVDRQLGVGADAGREHRAVMHGQVVQISSSIPKTQRLCWPQCGLSAARHIRLFQAEPVLAFFVALMAEQHGRAAARVFLQEKWVELPWLCLLLIQNSSMQV